MKAIKKPKQDKQTSVQEMIDTKWKRNAADVAKLSPEDLALLRAKQEAEVAELRAEYQPGKSFFSYVLPDDDDYRVLETLPTAERVEQVGAMRLTAGMIAGISSGIHQGRAMVIVAMHHNSRVVEYTFDLIVDKAGDTVLYEPFM